MAERTLLTVNQFSAKHPAYPVGGLRWMIFNEATNGLAEFGAVVRDGRKVLLDEDKFFARLDKMNKRAA